MTDNEIKKALECCAKNKGCDDCPLYAKESCFVVEEKALLDILNRKDAEIERLKPFEKKVLEQVINNLKASEMSRQPMLMITNNQLSENELMESMKKGSISVIPVGESSIRRIDEAGIKAEAIKEFAERLTEKADKYGLKYWATVEDIDNLVKEMTNDLKE